MPINTETTFDEKFSQAKEHYKAKQFQQAQDIYAELLDARPGDSRALTGLAAVYLATNKKDDAVTLFGEAIENHEDPVEAHFNLGVALELSGRSPESLTSYAQALSFDPNCYEAHVAISRIMMPGEGYTNILSRFHDWLKPATYVEIGVETGRSMCLAQPPTRCVGIDPVPQINSTFSAPTEIFAETSDDFFANRNLSDKLQSPTVDFAFIDGLHNFDAALRDFINIEKYCTRNTIILFHDCLPIDETSATRERVTDFWSGDTWKVIPCLKTYRPDLSIMTIATGPTGLAVVTNLDPESTALDKSFDQIVSEFMAVDFSSIKADRNASLNVISNDWASVVQNIEAAWAK